MELSKDCETPFEIIYRSVVSVLSKLMFLIINCYAFYCGVTIKSLGQTF